MSAAEKYAEQFRSMFDFGNAADIGRKNVEAMTAANQIMLDSAQEFSRRQAEAAQSSVQEVIEASRDVLSAGSPEAGMTKQAELTKHLFENGVENVREAAEMFTKSGMQAFEVINQSASENFAGTQKKASKK